MGFLDFVKKQFIDIIQWTEDGDEVLAWRFPMRDMEIQQGAQLTVRETQAALFVHQGKPADLFGPGQHTIKTQNIPLLTDLAHWDKMFESPFKSDIYFFSTRQRLNQKWGTSNPITIRDREFGAVRLRAFGIYSFRLATPRVFFQKVSGTRDFYGIGDLEGQLRNSTIAVLTDHFAESNIPFLDMAANQVELGAAVADKMRPMFADLGLALESLPRPEHLVARRAAEAAGRAHRHGRGRRHGTLHAVPDRAIHPGGGGQRGRYRRRRRRDRCGDRDGPGHGAGDEPGRRRRPAGRAGRPRCAGEPRGAGRPRTRNVWSLRQARAGRRAILSGVRRRAGPHVSALQRAPGQAQPVLPRLRSPPGLNSAPQQERRSTPCPSCGAPVTFTSAQSLLAVCSYCRASLIRRDLDVEQVGTMSALLEDSTPLQLAAEGVWRSTHFAVVGRVQIRWEQGMWNEWYCVVRRRPGGLARRRGRRVLRVVRGHRARGPAGVAGAPAPGCASRSVG